MMHILVVNSEAETRHHLCRWLKSDAFDITPWEADPQALDLAQFNEPLFIIGDWKQVAATSCLSTWQALKAKPGTPPIFCLMLIPADGLSDFLPALKAGADDWLTYPVDPVELRARVLAGQQILRLRQELQDQKRTAQNGAVRSRILCAIAVTPRLVPKKSRLMPGSFLRVR